MKNYDINKMLKEWGSTGMSGINPFPGQDSDPEDVEDLTADAGSKTSSDLTTNVIGPTDPQNRIPPDQKKLPIKEAPGDVAPTSTPAPPPKPKPKKEPPMKTPAMMGPPSGGMSPPPGGDPSMGGMEDPSMMGMGMGMPGPADSGEVGRIYELKKIYSRLVSMQSYLAGTTDVNLIKLRNYVSQTMDLFRTLISNIALYKDRLDEIIIVFYKVVDNVYVILSKYYKDKDSGKMIQAVE